MATANHNETNSIRDLGLLRLVCSYLMLRCGERLQFIANYFGIIQRLMTKIEFQLQPKVR